MKKTISVLLFIVLFTAPCLAGAATKVTVFQLKPTGGKEAEELSKAIQEMMLSQLIEKDSLSVVSASGLPADDKDAAAKALKDGSDYAVTGGIAIFGKTSNISMRLIDAKTASTVQAGNKTVGKNEEIPEAVTSTTQSFKTMLTSAGSSRSESSLTIDKKSAAVPVPSEAAVPVIPPVVADKSSGQSAGQSSGSDLAQNQASKKDDIFLMDQTEKTFFFKTQPVDGRIISLASVKAGKNSQPEVVALTQNQNLIFKRNKNNLELAGKSSPPDGQRNLRVDALDLDGDSHDEVYITRLNTHFFSPVASSNSLNGGSLTAMSSESNAFLSSTFIKCKKTLMLQREDKGSQLYSGDIYQVSGKNLKEKNVFKAPSGIFLDNFIIGQLTDKKNDMWLSFDGDNKLVLSNAAGEVEWEGDEKFGGTMESLEKPMEGSKKDETERKFFKQRIIVFCDQSGRNYMITAKNEDMAKGVFTSFKKFTSGKIVVLGWSGIGFKEIWTSEAIPGGIHDFELFDADGDGMKDIIFAASIESTFKSKGYIAGVKLPDKIAKVIN